MGETTCRLHDTCCKVTLRSRAYKKKLKRKNLHIAGRNIHYNIKQNSNQVENLYLLCSKTWPIIPWQSKAGTSSITSFYHTYEEGLPHLAQKFLTLSEAEVIVYVHNLLSFFNSSCLPIDNCLFHFHVNTICYNYTTF